MMKNYFENQRVNWYQFSPKDIIFKSNAITKKLLPEENVMSWKTKDGRHSQIAKKTGATPNSNGNYKWYSRDSYKAVFVQLTKFKQEYVCANLDFINYKPRKDSSGEHRAGLDALVYINSFHNTYQWQKDACGNWSSVKMNNNPLPDKEGYRIAYGGQGDTNYMTHREFLEVIDISESVSQFLANKVLPFKRGQLAENN